MAEDKNKYVICPKCRNAITSDSIVYGKSEINCFDYIADIPPVRPNVEKYSLSDYILGLFPREITFGHKECGNNNLPVLLLKRNTKIKNICIVGMNDAGKDIFVNNLLKELKGILYDSEFKEKEEINESTEISISESEDISPEYIVAKDKKKTKIFVVYNIPSNKFNQIGNENQYPWEKCITRSNVLFVLLNSQDIISGEDNYCKKISHHLYKKFEDDKSFPAPKIVFLFTDNGTSIEDIKSKLEGTDSYQTIFVQSNTIKKDWFIAEDLSSVSVCLKKIMEK